MERHGEAIVWFSLLAALHTLTSAIVVSPSEIKNDKRSFLSTIPSIGAIVPRIFSGEEAASR
jgi:hypothetical protein